MPTGTHGRLLAAALALVFALVLLPSAASAAAPSNDDFADAAPLTLDDVVSASNLDATAEAQEPDPSGGVIVENDCTVVTTGPDCAATVWYVFHAPASTNYTIETCDRGTDVDTVLGLWTGTSLSGLTEQASNDDGAGTCAGADHAYGSRVAFNATAGTDYFVQVSGYRAAQGSFYLRALDSATLPTDVPDTQISPNHSVIAAQQVDDGYVASGPRRTASFDFFADRAGASFECAFDGGAFSPCVSPVSYDGVSGSHTFAVRSVVNGFADPTPALQRFTIDNSPPETSFLTPPPLTTANPDISWAPASSERNYQDHFLCSLDGEPFTASCGASNSAHLLCNGPHEIRDAALDVAYNADPTPAVADVTETGGSACATPTLNPPSVDPGSGTEQNIGLTWDTKGAGGRVHFEWGTSSAYGNSFADAQADPGSTATELYLAFLKPNTEYHYRATLTTPNGSADTGDQTFTTSAGGTGPSIGMGTPVVVGHYAAAIPLTLDAQGENVTEYGVMIDPAGPANAGSPQVLGEDMPSGTISGPQARTLDLVDLVPGTTYHVRAFAYGVESVTSATEATITVPPLSEPVPPAANPPAPQPAAPVKPHFKLKRSSIKIGRLSRHSRFVTLTVKNLPPSASVGATLNARIHSSALKRLAHGQAKANKRGVAKLKVKLPAKARKLLRNRRVKSVTLTVTVRPRGQKATHITFHPKLRK